MKVLENTGADEFEDSVKEFVKRYRLPCFSRSDVPVRASQEFVFEPGDGRKVVYGNIIGEQRASIPRSCFSLPSDVPYYPPALLQRGVGGTLLAKVRFDQPNEPPKISFVYNARSPALERSVRAQLETYRFVCPLPDGGAVIATQSFHFEVSGATRYAFKDVELKEFLGMVDPVDLNNPKFDFTQMSCPFDLSVTVRRPHSENMVGEYGESDPRRMEFIAWVEHLTVMLPREKEPYLFDKAMKVSMPCLILNL